MKEPLIDVCELSENSSWRERERERESDGKRERENMRTHTPHQNGYSSQILCGCSGGRAKMYSKIFVAPGFPEFNERIKFRAWK
jgi:hypothetical protein